MEIVVVAHRNNCLILNIDSEFLKPSEFVIF